MNQFSMHDFEISQTVRNSQHRIREFPVTLYMGQTMFWLCNRLSTCVLRDLELCKFKFTAKYHFKVNFLSPFLVLSIRISHLVS